MKTSYPNIFGDGGKIVYVREVAVSELPDDVREHVDGLEHLFSVHDADGQRLALVANKPLAFALAREHDYAPVSVH
ncbi:DUF1150 family protein [Celeribacter marinus]|uniref:Uncharacterized protein n=1 Tax=Celeribacter marinus TaxID=1397108 RepID=A0A0N7HIF3_9RHOB|nr:DUF1150 family protein [Celeribacter marinus]ALI55061.1 hypothetical protein IMCC12053_1113 [Celeribacter marinus]SFK06026.1 hypothetical protein SAMN05444421_101264 [Celeribacter marinus]